MISQRLKPKTKYKFECFNNFEFNENAYHCKTCGRFAKCANDSNNKRIDLIQEQLDRINNKYGVN